MAIQATAAGKKYIVISDDDTFKELTLIERDLGRCEEAIRTALGDTWQRVEAIGTGVVGTGEAQCKAVLTVASKAGHGIVYGDVRPLCIDTIWSEHEGVTWPTWNTGRGVNANAQQMRKLWQPSCRLVLAVLCQWSVPMWYFSTAYLVGVDDGFYKLPMPNTYPEARLCMGDGYSSSGTLAQVWKHALQTVQASQWGSHLLSTVDEDKSKALFSYDAHGQQRACADWKRHCTKVNSTWFEPVR